MAIVVFIYFRIPVPSLAVVLAAFCDIIETVAVVNMLDVKIGTAGIAAFLMLIGYSVDTDILLTTRVLKRKDESVFSSIVGAAKTGILMTGTALVAVTIALIFAQAEAIREIMIIVFIGLAFDIVNTWIQNAAILRWYVERKHGKS
jgi:preprotein translocase subunit SecF